jgi:hypothetical protein
MQKRKKVTPSHKKLVPHKDIRYECDFQLDWAKHISTLRGFTLESVGFLTMAGDAPKDFVTDSEYRPGHRARWEKSDSYIAKVGSKFYPNESITEHLITRIGQLYGLNIADSKLRIIGDQVRFMSKYFLRRHSESLTHGAEIYELSIGKENYAELMDQKREGEYFSFQMTVEAINSAFTGYEQRIIPGYVEMLAFDALIGHNDRHPFNWGVIVPVSKGRAPRFAPVFDTARALLWNIPEWRLTGWLTNQASIEAYIRGCKAPICWDGEPDVDFFRLIGLMWQGCERYRGHIEKFLVESSLQKSLAMVDKEFGPLMSETRRTLIKRCLTMRQQYLCRSIEEFKGRRS